jgi:hypothetical protein
MQDEESGVPASDELSLEQSGEHFEAQPVEAATETTTASSLPPTDNHDGHARADDVVDIHCSLNGKWEDSFNRLLLFKAVHGHVLVPNRYPEDTHLGSWGESFVCWSKGDAVQTSLPEAFLLILFDLIA